MIVHGHIKKSYTEKKKKQPKYKQTGTNKVKELVQKPIFAPRGQHTLV